MLQLSWKFDESKLNPYWVIMLTNSSGTNFAPNGHEDFDQYGPNAIPSDIMPCYSYPEGLKNQKNQNEIPIDLSC